MMTVSIHIIALFFEQKALFDKTRGLTDEIWLKADHVPCKRQTMGLKIKNPDLAVTKSGLNRIKIQLISRIPRGTSY